MKFNVNTDRFVKNIKNKIDTNMYWCQRAVGEKIIFNIRETMQPKGSKGYYTQYVDSVNRYTKSLHDQNQIRSFSGEPWMNDTHSANRGMKAIIGARRLIVQSTAKDEDGFDYPAYLENERNRPTFYPNIKDPVKKRSYIEIIRKNILK